MSGGVNMRQDLSDQDAKRLLIGAPVAIVTCRWHGVDNATPVAWHMPLSNDPPLVGVALHPSRHSYDIIRNSEQFAINIPGRRLINHVQYLGSVSGRDLQKIDVAKLPTFEARKLDLPLLEGCVGYIECGLEDALRIGDHVLFVGRVEAVYAEEEAFSETWLLEDDDMKPLHYLGGEYYAILGQRLQAQLRTAAEARAEEKLEEALAEALEKEREEQERRAEEELHQRQRGES